MVLKGSVLCNAWTNVISIIFPGGMVLKGSVLCNAWTNVISIIFPRGIGIKRKCAL